MISAMTGSIKIILLPMTRKSAKITLAAMAKGIINGKSPIYEKFSGER